MADLATHRLDAGDATLVFAWTDGPPSVAYFGPSLAPETDLDMLVRSRAQPLGLGTLDVVPGIALIPEAARGFTGYPGLIAHRPEAEAGAWDGRFAFESVRTSENAIAFKCSDQERGLVVEVSCKLCPTSGVAVFATGLTNVADTDVIVDWLSAPAMNVPPHLSQQMRFNGRWCAEFEMERRDIPLGISSTENRRGRTSHESFPGLVCLEAATTQDQGACLGLHLGWSGNHRIVVERKSFGLTQAQLGLLPLAGELRIGPGQTVTTPELFAAMSETGLNGMSQAFHAYLRTNLIRWPAPNRPRPVTTNTWEAIYFDHDLGRLKALADAAAESGVERFVLDDGWFKGRTDDTRALGDWTPDPDKYPDGLHPIVDYVVDGKGMEFGLWFEPEMVNADSDLYRAHPEWALGLEGYPHVLGRNQLVLDLTNEDVSSYLFERLATLLGTYRIGYLKWDMNRDLVLAGDRHRRPAGSRQTRALYRLIDRVRDAFPHVEIESCASGGARVDFEILKRTHRFWPSDSNDPVERARIQTGFSYFFPPEVMGSHVGPTWSHTSGRGCTPEFRSLTAGAGHFGFELDLAQVPDADREVFVEAVGRYKADREIWHSGRLWRLATGDPNLIATAASSNDKRHMRVFALQIDRARSVAPTPLRLRGLEPLQSYRVRLTSGPPPERSGTRRFDNPLGIGSLETSGEVLMRAGVQLPVLYAQSGVAIAVDAVTQSA